MRMLLTLQNLTREVKHTAVWKATSEVSPQLTDGMSLKGVCVPLCNFSECFQWELGCGGLQEEGLWPLPDRGEIQLRRNR